MASKDLSIILLVILGLWITVSDGCPAPKRKQVSAPAAKSKQVTVPAAKPKPAPAPIPPTFFEMPIVNTGGDFGVKEPNGYLYSCAEWCASAPQCKPFNKRQIRHINMYQQKLTPDYMSRQKVAVKCNCYYYGQDPLGCTTNYRLDLIKQNYIDKCTKPPPLPDVLLPNNTDEFWNTRLKIEMGPTRIIKLAYSVEPSVDSRDGMVMRVTWDVRSNPEMLLGFLMVAHEEKNVQLFSHMILPVDSSLQVGSNKSFSSYLANFNEHKGTAIHMISLPDYVFIREAYVRAQTVNNKAVPNMWTVKWKKTELPPKGPDGKAITYDDKIGYTKFVIFMKASLNQPWKMVWATPSNKFQATVEFVASSTPTVGVLGETDNVNIPSGDNPCSNTNSGVFVPKSRVNDVQDDQLSSMMREDSNIKHESCAAGEVCALEVRRGGGNCLSQTSE